MTTAKDLGALTVSMLAGEEGMQNKELTKLIDYLRAQMQPDVVILSNALMVGMARRIRRELDVPVICTMAGEDAFLDSLIPPYRQQAWDHLKERAADIAAFVPVSRYYGDLMGSRLSLPSEKLHVIYNGIDITGFGPASAPTRPTIGFLARMCVGKGLGTLIDAFVLLKKRDRIPDLHLTIAGSANKTDEPFVKALKDKLQNAKLADQVSWHPNLDHAGKQNFLRTLSVLSVPATYGEAFGLYLLEAWASGVPVVQPRHAAFPELIERTGGGILCPPDDPAALGDALEIALLRGDESQRMGQAARRQVLEGFTVDHMARAVLELCQNVRSGPVAPARCT
jgi:glycosyltransferase involved in cell wall biosynthesis